MMCYWCGAVELRRAGWADYRHVRVEAEDFWGGHRVTDADWLCPACLAALEATRRARMEVRRIGRMDESPDAQPPELEGPDAGGALVLPGREAPETGLDEIWDEIRFR